MAEAIIRGDEGLQRRCQAAGRHGPDGWFVGVGAVSLPDFARMASAQFVSNIGSWMQTVGAQELMLTLTTSATPVALIQTAAGLPVVLLSVPAGAIGDLVDRRRLLIASQSFMLIAALLLAGLAFAGLVTPLILLALIFAVGIGQRCGACRHGRSRHRQRRSRRRIPCDEGRAASSPGVASSAGAPAYSA